MFDKLWYQNVSRILLDAPLFATRVRLASESAPPD
jgi:hypothetical protein